MAPRPLSSAEYAIACGTIGLHKSGRMLMRKRSSNEMKGEAEFLVAGIVGGIEGSC